MPVSASTRPSGRVRRYLHRLALTLACLLLAWPAFANLAGQRQVKVQLNWKHQFEFAAFYAAIEQGYYRQAGLDVILNEGGPGVDTVQEVIQGRADFGIGASNLIVDRARGLPVVALAALMQHSPVGLLALRKHGIQTVHDLAGRPIAVDPHNRDEVEAYLLASGIPRPLIHLTDQLDWTLDSLEQGRVAAKVMYVSNEPFWIRQREHEFLMLTPRSAGIDLFGNILFTTEAQVQTRPEMVKRFRAATLRGLVYALDNPERLADLILARYNTQGKSREHLLFEAERLKELTRPDIVEPGYMNPGRWQHVMSVYASQGKIEPDFDIDSFIYNTHPNSPHPLLLWSLAGLAAVLIAAVFFMIKLRRLNQNLESEVAQHLLTEQALKISEAKYRELVETANAIILRMDLDGTVTYFNEYAERFFGYSSEEILGCHVIGTIVPERETDSDRDLMRMIDAILARPEDFTRNENENMTRDGRRVFVRWANMVIFDEQRQPVGISCIGQDVTENRKAEETIRNLAFYDGLTALPNRRLLIDRLHQAMALSGRLQEHGALLFIDLDNFKLINDSHGHAMGDRLLVEAARRLQSCVREADSVARLGGDEFVVMLEELDIAPELAARQARAIAAKILETLSQPYSLGELDHHCSASIGIALFFEKNLAVEELLKRADLAMYQAKAAGRNTLRFFDPAMQAAAEARSRLETELHLAVRRKEFMFHYQPQVNAAGHVIGLEALARWQHPSRGLVMPADFIGPAEETGLIIPIGQQLLHQACVHLATLAAHPASARLSISINISARQFHHAEFIDSVMTALRSTGANPARLILELTESMLLDNIDESIDRMHMLKATGIRFAIDDFGTGYSSLAYLKRLPLDELKIDRSFVADIETDENDAAICAAFISLAHILGLRVVAEGVETEAQRIFLAEVHGCDAMQGWLFGKPLPAERLQPVSALAA